MEGDQFHTPVTDILDSDDHILQGDPYQNELRKYFASPNSAYAGAVQLQYTDTNTKSTGGNKTVKLGVGNTHFPKQTSTSTATTGYLVHTVERDTPEIVG